MGRRYSDDDAFGGVTYEAAEPDPEAIRAALGSAGVDPARIGVRCAGGVVTLTGPIPRARRAAAFNAVSRVPGVVRVEDELTAGGVTPGPAAPRSDG